MKTMAIATALAACALAAGAAEFHVELKGDDANPGTAQKPFATVERAVDALRGVRKASAEPVAIRIGAGRHELARSIRLSASDTTGPVVFEGAGQGKTILSGGRVVSGWRIGEDGRSWVARLPDVSNGVWRIEQLWVNGRRALRPSLPRGDWFYAAGRAPGATNSLPDRFTAEAGDISDEWLDITNGVELIAAHGWNITRTRIKSYDPVTREVRLAAGRGGYMRDFNAKSAYRLENVKAAFTEPGEWYCDHAAGTLSYMPRLWEMPKDVEVVAPRLSCLFEIKGEGTKRACGVALRGLTLAYVGEPLAGGGTTYHQTSVEAGSAVTVERAERVVVERCAVRHTGGWAVKFGEGCADCAVRDSELFDLGAGGVAIGSKNVRRGAQGWTHGCRVERCLIAGYGRVQPGATGVAILLSGGNTVARNTIRDGYYSGVSVGYAWGWGNDAAGGNVVEGNHIYDIGRYFLSDLAGIYTLGEQPGSVLRGNLIHDVTRGKYGAHGIYFDDGSASLVVSNNVVTRASEGAVKIGGRTKNILIANNIFLFGKSYMVWPCRDSEPAFGNRMERNVVQWDEECAKIFGDKPSDRMSFASNTWWQAAWPESIWFTKGGGTNEVELFDETKPARWKTWRRVKTPSADAAAWFARAPGDQIIDPRIGAPYGSVKNLRVWPDSPAVDRGFVPFCLDGAVGRLGTVTSVLKIENATSTFPPMALSREWRKKAAAEKAKGELRMTVFNQRYILGGAGMAVAFRTPDGRTYFFDLGNGGEDPVPHNCGRNAIMPWLLENDIREVDGILVSHAHGDHFGGLLAMLGRVPVKALWDSQYTMPSISPERLFDNEHGYENRLRKMLFAENPFLMYRPVRQFDAIDWGPSISVEAITPLKAGVPFLPNPKRMKRDGPEHNLINANALGIRVEHKDVVFQIMGDIQEDYEAAFLLPSLPEKYRKCDVLMPCSHGIHATPLEAQTFRPKAAIGTVYEDGAPDGWSRRWASTLPIWREYRAVGAEVYVCGVDGAVTVTSDGKKFRVDTQFGKKRRVNPFSKRR